MLTRRLGRCGHESSVAILSAEAFALSTEDEVIAAFENAVARGVNHLDISPSSGDAGILVGEILPKYRHQIFVSGKTIKTNSDGVRIQMTRSLENLQIDRFDLYQGDGLTSIFDLDGRAEAMAAMFEARDEGITGFVGMSAHGSGAPGALIGALRRYDLDTVMFPLYPRAWADQAYRHDSRTLLEECAESDVGVMVTNAVARRPWGNRKPTHATWYEPQTSAYGIQRGVNFALSTEGIHAFCTPGDLSLLPEVLAAAENFTTITGSDYATAIVNMSCEDLVFPTESDLERLD